MIPTGLRELMSAFPHPGQVVWIGVRPAPRMAMQVLDCVEAIAGRGLAGDRSAGKSRPGNRRQVTLIQAEHLAVVGKLLRGTVIDASRVRRNIVVSGINLLALKGHAFRIGDALLEVTGECHPCSLMESQLGAGGYNAMRGHGGMTARVLEGGWIRTGAAVTVQPLPDVAE
ncbi:MAG: MOSC domain-containing protein [Betaproteobacteria bacterium]